MKFRAKQFHALAWAISATACLIVILVFAQGLRWKFNRLDAYRLFPLFGLLAFSLFLSHYIVAALRQLLNIDKEAIKQYFLLTSLTALGFVILHPSLLVAQLYVDGFGLPPGSYLENYVAPSLKWAATLGLISLVLFLAYELTRLKSFKRWVPWLQGLSDIAMILILIHGFQLGSHLQAGWFRPVWLAYAGILLVCLSYTYFLKVRSRVSSKGE